MKHKAIILTLGSISLFSSLSLVCAQNIDSLKIEKQQNINCENKLEEEQKNIVALQKNIDKLKSENESLRKQVDKKNIKYLENQIDSLNNSILILRDSIFIAENTIKDLKIKLDSTDKEIYSLRDEMVLLLNIKEQYIQSKVDEVNHYIAKPYSELSDSTFANYIKILSPISGMDKIVKELVLVIDLKYANFNEYKGIVNDLTDRCYTKQLSQELDCRIDSLMKLSNPAQINDLKQLKEIIAEYPRAISEFQFLAQAIYDQVGYMRGPEETLSEEDKKDANEAVEMVLKDNKIRLERSYKYSIAEVPRLKEQFDKYLEIISKNPLSEDAVSIEKEILDIDL